MVLLASDVLTPMCEDGDMDIDTYPDERFYGEYGVDKDVYLKVSIINAAKDIGNGNVEEGVRIIKSIGAAVSVNRNTYPVFAKNKNMLKDILCDDIQFLCDSIEGRSSRSPWFDAMDTIADLVRYCNKELTE